jgi:hypothetical protein
MYAPVRTEILHYSDIDHEIIENPYKKYEMCNDVFDINNVLHTCMHLYAQTYFTIQILATGNN